MLYAVILYQMTKLGHVLLFITQKFFFIENYRFTGRGVQRLKPRHASLPQVQFVAYYK
jgi:hypothetical protein